MTVDVTVVSPLYRTATFARQLVDRLEWTFTQAGLSWSGVFRGRRLPRRLMACG